MITSTSNKLALATLILTLSACHDSTQVQDSATAPETQINQTRQQERDVQLDEMQEELRLVIKEIVALNSKFDSLISKPQAVAQAKNGERLDLKVNLPPTKKMLGAVDAKYAIVEFMDYQCPYCIRYAKQSLPIIKQRYVDTGKLKYVIRDFPLNFHSKAQGAAIAANCAGEQSKYWPMHDELVANSKSLGDELYPILAAKLNLDLDAYSTCLNSPDMKKAVELDFAYGTEIGIRGTPNFYIGKIEGESIVNVIHISGARSVEAFDRAIQQAMTAN
jgi:protein-disulfide isomerase